MAPTRETSPRLGVSQLRAGAGTEGQTGKGKQTGELPQLVSTGGMVTEREVRTVPALGKGEMLTLESQTVKAKTQSGPGEGTARQEWTTGSGMGPRCSQAVCLCPPPHCSQGSSAMREWGHTPTVTGTLCGRWTPPTRQNLPVWGKHPGPRAERHGAAACPHSPGTRCEVT